MKRITVKAHVKILAETHFSKHFAARTSYTMAFSGKFYRVTFWQFFLDDHEPAIILN